MQLTAEAREPLKLELAESALRSGRTILIKVLGMSMMPSIWPGDVVAVENRPCQQTVLGDIILVLRDGRFFVHRCIATTKAQGELQWITRGDAMPQRDPPVDVTAVLGKVARIEGRRGIVYPSGRMSFFTRVAAWILCHCDWVRGIALRIHSTQRSGAHCETGFKTSSSPFIVVQPQ